MGASSTVRAQALDSMVRAQALGSMAQALALGSMARALALGSKAPALASDSKAQGLLEHYSPCSSSSSSSASQVWQAPGPFSQPHSWHRLTSSPPPAFSPSPRPLPWLSPQLQSWPSWRPLRLSRASF